jgi:hypothetical protein
MKTAGVPVCSKALKKKGKKPLLVLAREGRVLEGHQAVRNSR